MAEQDNSPATGGFDPSKYQVVGQMPPPAVAGPDESQATPTPTSGSFDPSKYQVVGQVAPPQGATAKPSVGGFNPDKYQVVERTTPTALPPSLADQDDPGTWQKFKDIYNDKNSSIISKVWDAANTPLLSSQTLTDWEDKAGFDASHNGWLRGANSLVAGLSTPLSLGLMLGTGGASSLVESGGAAMLAEEGMTAAQIADVSEGVNVFSKAQKLGKSAEEAYAAVKEAGMDPALLKQGLDTLAEGGMTADSLIAHGIIRRSAGLALRRVGMAAADADKLAHATQVMVDAGFTTQMAYGAAVTIPSFLDAVKDEDYDKAKELLVEGFGSGGLATLGAMSFRSDVGHLMSDMSAAAGLQVKPTEEVQMLRNSFGKGDADKLESSRAMELDVAALEKKYPNLSKQDRARIMNAMQSENDAEMAQRGNILARAGNAEHLKIPLPDDQETNPQLNLARPPKSSEFQTWFGNSAIVDERGAPKTVYHNTATDFTSFDTGKSAELGTHFGTVDQANEMSLSQPGKENSPTRKRAQTMPVYLKIENPLRLEDAGSFEPEHVVPQLEAKGVITPAQAKDILRTHNAGETLFANEKIKTLLKNAGYDGITYLNRREGIPGTIPVEDDKLSAEDFKKKYPAAQDSYIALDPEQIKFALEARSGSWTRKLPIHPKEYLDRIGADANTLIQSQADRDKLKVLRDTYSKGEEDSLPPARMFLDHEGKSVGHDHEGSLRALVAHELGMDSVPVDTHKSGTPDEEFKYLADSTGKQLNIPAVPHDAEEAAKHARYEELAGNKHVADKYTPEEVEALVDSYDYRKLTPAHQELAKELRGIFNETLERAQRTGALNDKQAVENYVTQLWDKEHDASRKLIHDSQHDTGFYTNTSMMRKRVFENAFEGQLLGNKLRMSDPIKLAAYNRVGFDTAIANRKTLAEIQDKGYKASDGRPAVAPSTSLTVATGEDGEDPTVFVHPSSVRNIRIADKVIEGLKNTGDLKRMLDKGDIVEIGKKKPTGQMSDTDYFKKALNDKFPGKGFGALQPAEQSEVMTLADKYKQDAKANPPIYAWNTQNYKDIDHPAMQKWMWSGQDTAGNPVLTHGNLKVHPEMYEFMRKQLGMDKSGLKDIAKVPLKLGQEAKGILLFGSPFHLFQEGLRAIMTGVSPIGIDKWDLRTDPVLKRGVEKGLTLTSPKGSISDWEAGSEVGHSKILSKIPLVGQYQAWTQDFLFKKYIPGLKARSYRTLVSRYAEAYPDWTADKIAETAAADTNERFGGINYKRLGRSATMQDAARLLTLAPDWLESEVRFLGRTMGSEGKVARADVAKFALGLWAAARVLNYVSTGRMHNEAPFGLAMKGKNGDEKIYSIRTLPTDMLHAVSDPAGFMRGRMSPLVRSGTEMYTGRDEHGKRLPDTSLLWNIAQNSAPIPLQSTIKAAGGQTPELPTQDQVIKGMGATVFPYRTEAQKVASQFASDHSESGPVHKQDLVKHQLMMKFEDDLRSGDMQPQQLYEMVDKGEIAPKEAKKVLASLKETAHLDGHMATLYRRSMRLSAPELVQVWDKAQEDEKQALQPLMQKAAKAYYKKMLEESPESRMADPTYKKLRAIFPQVAPF